MIALQLELFRLAVSIADQTHNTVGLRGEIYAQRLLEASGYQTSTPAERHTGDIRAVDTATGEVFKVEVKTARRGRDGLYQFCLRRGRKTNVADADWLLMLAISPAGLVTRFLMPASAVDGLCKFAIRGAPEGYSGRFAPYRHTGALKLEKQACTVLQEAF